MANVNKPMGLTPVKYLNGADWDGRGSVYSVATALAEVLSPGDPVMLSGTADATGCFPGIVRATAGAGATTPAVGVLLAIGTVPNGPFVNPNNLTTVQKASAAAGVYYALVADDPNIIYEIQEDSVGGSIGIASVGLNANFIYANPATGVVVSAAMLDSNTVGASATALDLKILRLAPVVGNALGTYAKWWVMFNTHAFRPGIIGY